MGLTEYKTIRYLPKDEETLLNSFAVFGWHPSKRNEVYSEHQHFDGAVTGNFGFISKTNVYTHTSTTNYVSTVLERTFRSEEEQNEMHRLENENDAVTKEIDKTKSSWRWELRKCYTTSGEATPNPPSSIGYFLAVLLFWTFLVAFLAMIIISAVFGSWDQIWIALLITGSLTILCLFLWINARKRSLQYVSYLNRKAPYDRITPESDIAQMPNEALRSIKKQILSLEERKEEILKSIGYIVSGRGVRPRPTPIATPKPTFVQPEAPKKIEVIEAKIEEKAPEIPAFVTIPDSVTSIDDGAYSDCATLVSIAMPETIVSIGQKAFYGCIGLSSIKLPNSLRTIKDYAFAKCIGLASISIPDSVTFIGQWAFTGCASLTAISLPAGLNSIEKGAFSPCAHLSYIVIPDSVTSIADYAFADCSALDTVYLPRGLQSIGQMAFARCLKLTSIFIPNSVTSVGEWAFVGCSDLTIYCEAESCPEGWNADWNGGCSVVWGYKK